MTIAYSAVQVNRARELLTRLSATLRGARFYPIAHPAVQRLVEELQVTLDAYFAEGVDVELTFNEGEILLGEIVLPEESVLFDQLVRDLYEAGASNIMLRRGLTRPELSRFAALLVLDSEELQARGGIAAAAAAAKLTHIYFAAVTVYAQDEEEDLLGGTGPREAARRTYEGAIEALREFERSVGHDVTGNTAPVRAVVSGLIDHVIGNTPAIMELASLKDYDEYTFYHSVNTAILSLGMGAAITRDRRFLSSLGIGSLLHDVGKLAVGIDIVTKEGPLTADEWEKMCEHPVYGAEAAARMTGLDRSVIVIIYEHHRRMDGSGYPAVTAGRGQSLPARIVAIADSYDAMTSQRTYSAARLPDEAMGVLVRSAGVSYDERLVRLFVRIMGVYPPRSVVRLTSGELAAVSQADHRDPARPHVVVFAGPDGGLLGEPRQVALSEAPAAGLEIVGCIDAAAAGIDVEDYL